LWAARHEGHLRTQGYEDAGGDSLRPPKWIHLTELAGNSFRLILLVEEGLGALLLPLVLGSVEDRLRLRLLVRSCDFRVQDSGFRVQGSGFRGRGSGFRVQATISHSDTNHQFDGDANQ
jgi:hypothetical protein